jgi:hypothetical protein
MYKIYLFCIVTILISCNTKIRYIGKTLPETKSIEVFISEQSVKRPFEYIGKGYIGGLGYPRNQNIIQKKAEKLGIEKGADAVLITDHYIPDTGGTNITTVFKTDSITNGTVTTGSTSITPTSFRGYNIVFLKYKE